MEITLQILQELAKVYGGQTAIYIILLIFTLYVIKILLEASSKSIARYIEKKFFSKDEDHKKAITHRKNVSPKIRKMLSDVAEATTSDRALVFEYSNGNSNLVGLPFLYVTATCEVLKPNVSAVSHLYQRINVSLLATFIEELEDKGHIFIEDFDSIKEVYPILYYMMKKNDVTSGIFYRLDGMDESIGFVCLTKVVGTLDKDRSIVEIAHSSQRISSLLNYNNITENINDL